MKTYRLENMLKGWFIGDFEPTAHKTKDFEAAVKRYPAGASEAAHFHKVAKEITLIESGEVEMAGQRFSAGDIVVLDPGEASAFRAITDCVTVVIKVPSAAGDKYLSKVSGNKSHVSRRRNQTS